MPTRPQQRDHLGHFVQSVQPQQEAPILVTPQALRQPNTIQCLFLVFNTPLVSDVPVSEFISNITQALHLSSPMPNTSDSPPSLPLASDSTPSTPILFIPPPCYATDPPLPVIDFDIPGTLSIRPPPLSPPTPENNNMPWRHTLLSGNKLLDSDDEQLKQLPPPLPPRPYQAPPQPPRQRPRARLPPQPQFTRALLPPPLQPIPQAPQAVVYASPQGVAAMPSKRSKLAPFYSGEVKHPIEDFLDEYEELADKCGLTGPQKVETVIRYIDRSQRHIWQALPGYTDRNWDNFCNELCKEYINPTTEGQFSKQKLLDFANKYTRKCMSDKTDVINYQRKFNSLSKTLLKSGRITKGEYNAIFWHRFHPEDQQELHKCLIAKHPDKPKGQAFSIKEVLKIARAVFSGDDNFLYQEPPP